jgi:hypothetical protein
MNKTITIEHGHEFKIYHSTNITVDDFFFWSLSASNKSG